MSTDLTSFLSIAMMITYFLGLGFMAYFPLRLKFKTADALALTIPFSWSLSILVGYIFYSIIGISWFPIGLLAFSMAINFFCLKHPLLDLRSLRLTTWRWKNLIIVIPLIVLVLFSRFHDAFTHLSPGHNDTANHADFIYDLHKVGYLNNGYYAPGYHLLIFPISYLLPQQDLYRFAGPSLGIVIFLGFILLLKSFFQKEFLVLLVIAFLNPVFNQLTLVSIGLLSSQLSLLFFLTIIWFFLRKKTVFSKNELLVYLTIVISLGLSVPYLFIQFLPMLTLILLILFFQQKVSLKKAAIIWLISFLGLLTGFIHVYFQSSVLHRYSGFPAVPSVAMEGNHYKPITTTTTVAQIAEGSSSFIAQSEFMRQYLIPLYATFLDLIQIKSIRPLSEGWLSVGAYAIVLIASVIFFLSWRQKQYSLFMLSFICMFLGFITQTGALELIYYKGRTGWYLLLVAVIMGIFVLQEYQQYWRKNLYLHRLLIIGILFSILATLFFPAHFYRPYSENYFVIAQDLLKKYPDEYLMIGTDITDLRVLSPRVTTSDFELEKFGLDNYIDVLFVDKTPRKFDSRQAQQQIYVVKDEGFENNLLVDYQRRLDRQNNIIDRMDRPFSVFFEDSKLLVLLSE